MAKQLLCLLALSTIVLSSLAQSVVDRPKDFLAPPIDLNKDQISKRNVKAIHSKAYQMSSTGSKQDAGEEEFLQFDSLGHLVRQVEIEKHDTSTVRDYFYTLEGALNWEVFEDKSWNKSYKTGYRLNTDKTVFQTKNYEVLNADASMLVDTRRYKYREDGKPLVILCMTNGKVSESHHFEYDMDDHLLGELFKDSKDNLLRSITYEYKGDDLMKVTSIDFNRNNFTEMFLYTYNLNGSVQETQWLENSKLKGVISYEYDAEKNLQRVTTTLNRDRRKESMVKEFEYSFYQN